MQIETSQSNNYEPKSYKKFLLGFLVVLAFFLGWQYGRTGEDISIDGITGAIEKNRDNAPAGVNWQILWDTIEIINDKYVNKPVELQKVLYGAVYGAVSALGDPYSVFLPPQEAQDFKNELAGSLDGIGAEIAVKHQRLVVLTPLDGSPAIKAGIRPGDFIYKVGDEETTGMTVEQAVSKIRGRAGTTVKLTVFHAGETAPSEITITRARIEVKSVSSEIKTAGGKKIGYIKLRRFGEDTSALLDKVITDFLAQGVAGLVFDVRNNPGGFLESAIDVSSNWVKDGEIVAIQRFAEGKETIFKSQGPSRLAGLPTVVLINGGSASASEILAGALSDHGLAKLVGEKSFGKGSVQELIDLEDDAQLKLTIAKWLTPKGHDLNKEGLEPDIKIEFSEEDFQNDKDPQLDRALAELAK